MGSDSEEELPSVPVYEHVPRFRGVYFRAAPLPHHAGRFATWGASLSSQLSLLVMLFPTQRGTGRENPYRQPTAPGTPLSTPFESLYSPLLISKVP
jgi:hypothetical protein